MLGIIWKGIFIGLLVSAPMGPVGVLCIRRTLNKGRRHGFITGLGAMCSDVFYAAITMLGMGMVIHFVEANQPILQLIGSIVLGIFGVITYRTNPSGMLRSGAGQKRSLTSDFITGFLLTLSNILIILLYIGLFARFGFIHSSDQPSWHMPLGLLSIAVGAIIWWFGITYLLTKMKTWFSLRGIKILNQVVGMVFIIISAVGTLAVLIYYIFGFSVI